MTKLTKRITADYESEGSAIRRIMHAEALTKFGKGMDKTLLDKERATFKAQGTIKMRKSDGDGIHGTTVNKNDTAKIAALRAQGYVRVSEDSYEESEENINITEEDIKISPKLLTLLRMGLVEKGELETMKRALKKGEDALQNPTLRNQIFELFNKLVEAVTDDQQIWVRMRKRLTNKETGEE